MDESQKLIIVGEGEFGEIAYEYFTYDSPYDVVAFSAEKDYLNKRTLFGLPIVAFEQLEDLYDPTLHRVFVAVTHTKLNTVRTRLYNEVKKKGFAPVSYVSSKSFVWRDVEIGENCFIFENNVIQRRVRIGNNVILWSGNHIGHRTVIEDNVFMSLNAVVAGYCVLGENCFVGINSSIVDTKKVARDCIIGAGAVVIRDTEEGKVYVGNPAKPTKRSSYATFGVEKA
jgi:sugar O-acyltransferase (sialic acid O-acetyltransferase NeuD family)